MATRKDSHKPTSYNITLSLRACNACGQPHAGIPGVTRGKPARSPSTPGMGLVRVSYACPARDNVLVLDRALVPLNFWNGDDVA